MAEEQLANNYNISISIQDLDNYETDKINFFYIFRNPMVKQSSFAGMVLSIDYMKYAQLEDFLQKNEMPMVIVKVNFANPAEQEDSRISKNKDIKTLITKVYKILMCTSIDKDRSPTNQMLSVRLVLVNPILFQMQESNGFNRILTSITGMDALAEYESYLIDQYGITAVEFKKVGVEEHLNSHSYEHIQVRTETDLHVPDFLFKEKKALNSFAYYFFDDFRITPETTSDICGLAVNLMDTKDFKQTDIITDDKKNPDAGSMKSLGTIPLFNPTSAIMKSDPVTVGRDPEGRQESSGEGPVPIPRLKTDVVMDQINTSGRDFALKDPLYIFKNKPRSNIINLNNPDSVALGNERFATIQQQMKDTLRAFHLWDINDCYPDLYQFDRIYNLEHGAESIYSHVPISIVNIFKRDLTRPTLLTHGIRLQTVKFKYDYE